MRRRGSMSEQGGFTIVELLITGVIGIVILGSATMITAGAARHNNEVASRSDATQRGRLAMETMAQLLRSQACVEGVPTTITEATPTRVTFYADLKGGAPAVQHTLAYEAPRRQLTDTAVPVGNPAATTTRVLATNVNAVGGAVFRYKAYPAALPSSGALVPSDDVVPGTTQTLLDRVVQVDVRFKTTGELRTTSDIEADMANQILLRRADPNAASSDPTEYEAPEATCQ